MSANPLMRGRNTQKMEYMSVREPVEQTKQKLIQIPSSNLTKIEGI